MTKPKLLIVEDDEGLLRAVPLGLPRLRRGDGAQPRPAALAAGQGAARRSPILDLGLPPDPDGVTEGFATLEEMLRIAPDTKVIVATGNGEKQNALKAIAHRRL